MRSIRYSDQRQIIIAASDVATQIVSPTKRFFQIVDPLVGVATMFSMILPDARTIRTQTPFVFENASSNFVGIYNADLTTFHRVPPRATLTCTLKTQATASGTWGSMVHDPAVGNPAFGLSVFSDFNASIGVNQLPEGVGAYSIVSGAGAAFSQAMTLNMPGGRQGIAGLYAGTTATGYAQLVSPALYTWSLLGSGCRAVEASLAISVISTAADEYIARFGFGNNITGGAHTEGAYLLYDRVAAGIINWQFRTCKTAGGAGSTQTDTNVVPIYSTTAAAWQKLRVEINSTASRADAWIDNVQVSAAGGQANLPAVTTAIKHLNVGITQSAYAAVNHFMPIDYIRVQSYPTTPR